jgi:hypothetical protein
MPSVGDSLWRCQLMQDQLGGTFKSVIDSRQVRSFHRTSRSLCLFLIKIGVTCLDKAAVPRAA